MNWVDPWGLSASDGQGRREYSIDGAYLGGTTTGVNGIRISQYVYSGSASAGKLDLGFLRNKDGSLLTQKDFDTIVAAVVGEASEKNNVEEADAIADVIMNRAVYINGHL